MKKHLLSLIAVAFLTIGITACSNSKSTDDSKGEKTENNDDLKDPESVGTTFVDLLNDCTRKVSACTTTEELAAVGNQFEQDCEEFKNDEANLSDSERAEIVNAMTELSTAMGVKALELQGQTLTPEQIDMMKSSVKSNLEAQCGEFRNIKELLAKMQ